MSAIAWLAFLVAAAIGALARYMVDGFVRHRTSHRFPWGTLVVNVSGSFILGVLTGLGLHHGLDPTVRLVVGTGAMGAYTTFSSFTVETVLLAAEGATGAALRNAAGTFVIGLAAVAAGLAVTAIG